MWSSKEGKSFHTYLVSFSEEKKWNYEWSRVGEIAISNSQGKEFARAAVQRRPTALALSPSQDRVYVANTFSDSISIVTLSPPGHDNENEMVHVSLGPQPELSMTEKGEVAFYDASHSSDGWFSCHSCHVDGHSNGLLNDNFGDGSTGAAKRVLSLLGVANTAPWAWNGKVEQLEQQVEKSILTTMRGPQPSDEDVKAITAFLKTLKPPPSLAKARGTHDASLVERGRSVFEARSCADCHEPRAYTSTTTHDVGIHDSRGNQAFNPPSLLGVSQRERLFHDNRAHGLQDVFVKFKHGLEEPLPEGELNALLTFLNQL